MNQFIRTLITSVVSVAPTLMAAMPQVPAPPHSARTVIYSEKDVVSVKAKIRFTTLIVLPKQEQILDYTCGDKEFWIINGNQNFAYVKPAKAGSRTNLNLITASGNVYSFVLTEVSDSADSEPDLKIFVEPKDESMISATSGGRGSWRRSRWKTTSNRLKSPRRRPAMPSRLRRQRSSAKLPSSASGFRPASNSPIASKSGSGPLNVTGMYTDGKFTYIQAHPEEPPAL